MEQEKYVLELIEQTKEMGDDDSEYRQYLDDIKAAQAQIAEDWKTIQEYASILEAHAEELNQAQIHFCTELDPDSDYCQY